MSKDNEKHYIYNKKTKKIESNHLDKKSAYKELIDKHNFHSDLTVLHPSEFHIYGVKKPTNESEELDEMAGGFTTKQLHKHLKERGWELSRSAGGHDVFTHPKSKKNIAVPRHKGELSRPTALKIVKTAELKEEEMKKFKDFINEAIDHDFVQQSLADKDIDSNVKDGKIVVHKDNLEKAKKHIKKLGYNVSVVKESEELVEAKVTAKDLEKNKYGTSHAGAQHFSNINGKEHTWNYVKKHDGKWKVTNDRKDAHGIHIHGTKNVINLTEGWDLEELKEDLSSKLYSHINSYRDMGHHVRVTDRGADGRSAKFVSTAKDGTQKLHTVTMTGVRHETISKSEESAKTDGETEAKKRGRPAGSKSGSRH